VTLKITLVIAQTYSYVYAKLVHLSEYLYELYHFHKYDFLNFNNSIQFITKFINFSYKVTSNDK